MSCKNCDSWEEYGTDEWMHKGQRHKIIYRRDKGRFYVYHWKPRFGRDPKGPKHWAEIANNCNSLDSAKSIARMHGATKSDCVCS